MNVTFLVAPNVSPCQAFAYVMPHTPSPLVILQQTYSNVLRILGRRSRAILDSIDCLKCLLVITALKARNSRDHVEPAIG